MDVDRLRVLVLTAGMMPHSTVNWMDAVSLVYKGAASVVEEYAETVSSPSVTWHVPAVIQVKKNFSFHTKSVKFSRFAIYSRDFWECAFCGQKHNAKGLTYDHVIPRSRGGETSFKNIVSACKRCNRKKGARTPEEAKMPLRRKPYQPKHTPLGAFLVGIQDLPPEWGPYLAGYETGV
jgi:5-methylcytosine-specific restriction endonuclease McrA